MNRVQTRKAKRSESSRSPTLTKSAGQPESMANVSATDSAFLFDFDCTLVDSADFIYDAVNFALQKNRVPIANRRTVLSTLGLPLEQIRDRVVPNVDQREEVITRCAADYRTFYSKNHLGRIRPFPGVAEMLRELRGRGFRRGVISTKPKPPLEELLQHLGVRALFSVVVSGYEVTKPKPSLDIVYEAAKRLGVEPKRCVVVGDSARINEAFSVKVDAILQLRG